ncbi:MAG: hypothetical protein V7K90_00750 [Nostoc sp.]|uniref:hypothetical protein n=1 Tax=Nostoc sp. TaxID=1180 RepID=UPI002FF88243
MPIFLFKSILTKVISRPCDRNCPGIPVSSTAESSDSPETPVDNRWASLEALKKQLPG